MSTPNTCDHYDDDLAELALGTLTGRDRAEVLAHVESCGRCAGEVEELSRAADVLLQVAPEAEPPVGFEVRLLEQMTAQQQAGRTGRQATVSPLEARRSSSTSKRGRARRFVSTARGRAALAVAAAVVAVAGVGIGFAVAQRGPAQQHHPLAIQAALLGTDGQQVGRVVASGGSPTWLLMVVDRGTLSGKVTCRVDLTGGHWVTLGTFSLNENYSTWSSPLAAPPNAVHEAELVGPHGVVLATAVFATPA